MCQALEPVGHAWAARCTTLCMRARGGRGSFSLTAQPFDPKQKGKGERTLFLASSAARPPCRAPCSASTAGADGRYREFL